MLNILPYTVYWFTKRAVITKETFRYSYIAIKDW